jgi:hypothetical protein
MLSRVRKLPQLAPTKEGLGRVTIMDRGLASKHGPPYVHLAAFAIDVDRVRDALEDLDDPRPFGWEVFLTEAYLLAHMLVASDPTARTIVEDIVLGVLEGDRGVEVLGSQLPFAVWDAIERGEWPTELRASFRGWKARPSELVAQLAPLWADRERHVRELAEHCLSAELDPPLAPPTLEALRGLAGAR